MSPEVARTYIDVLEDAAEAYSLTGQSLEAVSCLQRVLACEEADGPETWVKIAACYEKAGDGAKAREWRRKAFEHDRSSIPYALQYSGSLIACDEMEEARRTLDAADFGMLA